MGNADEEVINTRCQVDAEDMAAEVDSSVAEIDSSGAEVDSSVSPKVALVIRIVEAIRALNVRPFEFSANALVSEKETVALVMVREIGIESALTIDINDALRVSFVGWKRSRRFEVVANAVWAIHKNTENPFLLAPMLTSAEVGAYGYAAKTAGVGPENVARSMALMREARWKPLHAAVETVIEEEKVLGYAETLTAALERTGVQPHLRKAALKRICDVIINYRRA